MEFADVENELYSLQVRDQVSVFTKLKAFYVFGEGRGYVAARVSKDPEEVYAYLFSDEVVSPGLVTFIFWKKYHVMTELYLDEGDHFILLVVGEKKLERII